MKRVKLWLLCKVSRSATANNRDFVREVGSDVIDDVM